MHQDEFVLRHIGPRELETNKMLASIEVESLEELLKQTIPEEIRLKSPFHYQRGLAKINSLVNSSHYPMKISYLKHTLGWVITQPIPQR